LVNRFFGVERRAIEAKGSTLRLSRNRPPSIMLFAGCGIMVARTEHDVIALALEKRWM